MLECMNLKTRVILAAVLHLMVCRSLLRNVIATLHLDQMEAHIILEKGHEFLEFQEEFQSKIL